MIPAEHRSSPGGASEIHRKHVSIALGGQKDIGVWMGGHPFDIELASIPPGKKNFPYHQHAAQWEYYIILSGSGRILVHSRNWHILSPGDHIICPPPEAHQIENNGDVDLVYYVISDHHPADVTTYPNTGKRQLKPEYQVVHIQPADYYKDEE